MANDIFGENYSDWDDTDWIINELIEEVEEFEDLAFIHAENLCSEISEMDLLLVYKLGEKEANDRLLQEHIQMKMLQDKLRLRKTRSTNSGPF